jgi:hypothetical protein
MLAVAYMDRQHKYKVFVLAVGNDNHQHIPAQMLYILVRGTA